MFCTRVALVCVPLYKEDGSSPVSLQLLRGGIWDSMRCPCLYLCWVLGWGLYVWYYVGVNISFNMVVWNARPRRHMCINA